MGATPDVVFEVSYQLNSRGDAPRNDIASLACAQDGGADRTLFVGFENSELQRVQLPPCNPGQVDLPIDASFRTSFNFHNGNLIEALAISGDSLLSLSSNGKAGLLNIASPAPSSSVPHMIDLDTRAWSVLLSTSASAPFVAFGTSSDTLLTIHVITPTSISATLTMVLRASQHQDKSALERPTAVYGIATAPPASPWGASDQIIVSGWFKGLVCVHDMRASPAPTLTFADPWSFEPIYTVAATYVDHHAFEIAF